MLDDNPLSDTYGVDGSGFFGSDAFLYPLDVASAECFHFTAEFEVSSNFVVVEDSEAVDDGQGCACPFDDLVGIEVEIRLMGYGEDECFDAFEGFAEVFLDFGVDEFFLVAEESSP